MNTLMTFLMAMGLALDAFSVAVTGGIVAGKPRLRHAFRIAFSFGFFQAFMPVIGWAAGSVLTEVISGVDHWIAFLLLSMIGLHMIYEAIRSGPGETSPSPLNIKILLLLSVATSIDALAAGIGLAFIEVAIVPTVIIIGVVTFFLSFMGYYIGDRIGRLLGNKVRILGGIILIGIGLKILIEHLR